MKFTATLQLLALFASLISVACLADDSISYKGISLGSSMEVYSKQFPDHQCSGQSTCSFTAKTCVTQNIVLGGNSKDMIDGLTKCRNRNSFGGVFPRSVFAEFRDGKLVSLSFTIGATTFDSLAGAAKERLGQPSNSSSQPVQMKTGAVLENPAVEWDRPDFILTIQKYATTVDEGIATLMTPEERAKEAAEFKAKQSAGAKDF